MAMSTTISNAPKELYIYDGVFPTDAELIKNRFYEEGYGKISKVELVKQYEGELTCDDRDLYSAAYLTIDYWNDSKKVFDFLKSLNNNNEKTVLYTGEVLDNNKEDYWELEIPFHKMGLEVEIDSEPDAEVVAAEEEDLKNVMASIVDRLSRVENKTINTEGLVNYLCEVDRNIYLKKERMHKAEKIMKERRFAQRKWRNRLRPVNLLRSRK